MPKKKKKKKRLPRSALFINHNNSLNMLGSMFVVDMGGEELL